jgi:hypothetical protein
LKGILCRSLSSIKTTCKAATVQHNNQTIKVDIKTPDISIPLTNTDENPIVGILKTVIEPVVLGLIGKCQKENRQPISITFSSIRTDMERIRNV